MSVNAELLCSFELLKPLDSSALKSHIKKGRNKRQHMLNSPVSMHFSAEQFSTNKNSPRASTPKVYNEGCINQLQVDSCTHIYHRHLHDSFHTHAMVISELALAHQHCLGGDIAGASDRRPEWSR